MCRAVGVLPLSLTSSANGKPEFFRSGQGKVFTVVNLILVMTYVYTRDLRSLASLGGLFTIQTCLTPIICLLLVLCYRCADLPECASLACKVYFVAPIGFKPFSVTLFVLMVLVPFATVFLLVVYVSNFGNLYYFLVIVLSNYLYASLAGIEVLVSLSCWISRRAITFINTGLDVKKNEDFNIGMFSNMLISLDHYILVARFLKSVSRLYGPYFLNSFVACTAKLLIFLVYIKIQTHVSSVVLFLAHAVYMSVRILLLCYNCEKIQEAMIDTLDILGQVRACWLDSLTQEQSALLDTYEDLMEVSQVTFSACGFFTVNMMQLFSVYGLIITYGLIAIQTK